MPVPPHQLPQYTSIMTSQCYSANLAVPYILHQAEVQLWHTEALQKQQDPATSTAWEDKKSRHTWQFEGLHFTHACKTHGKRVTPLPGDEGLYNRQRGQKDRKCSSQHRENKRAARRFYSSCQHPTPNQQFTLTTKLSKKRQTWALQQWPWEIPALCPGNSKKKKTLQHITYHTFLLKHDKEENIWQKRPKRGKPEINRI